MNDRELLELAAKAAGVDVKPHQNGKIFRDLIFMAKGKNWNPLIDDGDALRLAAILKIAITYPEDEAVARVWYGAMNTEPLIEDLGSDQYAATRRAIVRAAAEIGKTHDL